MMLRNAHLEPSFGTAMETVFKMLMAMAFAMLKKFMAVWIGRHAIMTRRRALPLVCVHTLPLDIIVQVNA